MLKYFLLIFLFLLSVTKTYALEIDDKTDLYNLLPGSEIYIDNTNSFTIDNIINIENKFKENDDNFLSYGYSPDFTVWLKFTLQNTTDKSLNKILEYGNPLTTHIEFYSPTDNSVEKEGLYQINISRKSINPIFRINLKPQESKTFYIKASSHITTLIVKLNLYNDNSFYEEEIKHQLILGLFFASMFILGIYNLFIYFFTKDISYLYYVLYIFGIIFHHFIYIGMANIYIINQEWIINFVEIASLLVAFPIFFLALFTKSFLQLKQYNLLNKILTTYLMLFPLIVYFFIISDEFSKYRNIFTFFLLIYLVLITIYAAFKKNRQAYFILFGWFVVLVAGTFMYISSVGIFNVQQYQPYIVEIAFVLEAVIFSIALADRIKQLQLEKNNVNAKLITQQKNEKERLEAKVAEKTIDLKHTADEKEMLLKELNHRVKNNMQTIVSLVRLQMDEIEDINVKNILSTTYNRITAMSHLHELLYYQKNISNVNASNYFTLLTQEIQESYHSGIKLHLDIASELKVDQAIYCGLILNELITNAFKHAFTSNYGNIYIKLSKDTAHYLLFVSDDGIGYDKNITSNSLGLVLVNSLVKSKLKGSIDTESEDGVKVTIKWENKNG